MIFLSSGGRLSKVVGGLRSGLALPCPLTSACLLDVLEAHHASFYPLGALWFGSAALVDFVSLQLVMVPDVVKVVSHSSWKRHTAEAGCRDQRNSVLSL